jgi:hypothetical protein
VQQEAHEAHKAHRAHEAQAAPWLPKWLNRPGVVEMLLFGLALCLYLANGQLISSNDSIPNSLLAFHWLENHTCNFDAFRGGHYYLAVDTFGANGLPYFWIEAANGHLASAYPIGAFIISLPLYLLFFGWLKLVALWQAGFAWPDAALNLTSPEFEPTRQFYEKLAGAMLTSASVLLFYRAALLNFGRIAALGATIIYGFATLNWAVSAQGLWAHTVFNFALISAMLCLFQANRAQGQAHRHLLLMAGFCCGLLPSIRLTGLLFTLIILLYGGFTYRKRAWFLLLGSASICLNFAWNIHYFGFSFKSLIAGGYAQLMTHSGEYIWRWDYFRAAFAGLLVSPSRGLLVFSPILLFAIPGIYQILKKTLRQTLSADELLLALLLLACTAVFWQYCFFSPWWGAISYGPRFLIDLLPVICYLISYYLKRYLDRTWPSRRQISLGLSLLLICFVFSTLVEIAGAFSTPHLWDTLPGFEQSRLWNWQDSQIERHFRNLYTKLNPPIADFVAYRQTLNGKVLQIKQNGDRIAAITATPGQQISLQAVLKNTGKGDWFGYETGLSQGLTVLDVVFQPIDAAPNLEKNDLTRNLAISNQLYIPSRIRSGEATIASGAIIFPMLSGEYRMIYRLTLRQAGRFPRKAGRAAYELLVKVIG